MENDGDGTRLSQVFETGKDDKSLKGKESAIPAVGR